MKIHRTTASTLAALSLVAVASCSAPAPAPAESGAPASSAPAGSGDAAGADAAGGDAAGGDAGGGDAAGGDAGGEAPSAALGQAATAVAGLAALGGLGQGQGDGEQVRGLGGQLVADAQALTDQLAEQGATAAGGPTAEQQAQLDDLAARTGQPFDQAWLRAATDALNEARDAANAVLASDEATPEQRGAAEDALARLDALGASLAEASTASGADTPQSVDAGSGGQAQDAAPVLALGLLGAGAALLGGAVLGGSAWRRRTTS